LFPNNFLFCLLNEKILASCIYARIIQFFRFIGALRYQNPALILFHTDCEPTGPYWEAFKAIAGKRLLVVKRTAPTKVWGIDVKVHILPLLQKNKDQIEK